MTAYDLAGMAVFVVLSLIAWAVVHITTYMPSAFQCPQGCKCRGQLSAQDHRDFEHTDR